MSALTGKFSGLRRPPTLLFCFIALWVGIVLLSGIRYGDLSGYDDAAYAHEARAMLQTGDVWTLNLNGAPDFDKPPLFIWLVAVSFKIFGVNDFAAKLPGVLLGAATVWLLYFLARELFSGEAAEENAWLPALAALCLATTQYFLKNASHAMTDVPFAFFFTLAVYLYLRGLKNKLFFPAAGVAVGLAILTRAPIGFFPLGIFGLHLLYTRRFRTLFSWPFAALVLLAALMPAVWYLREYDLYGAYFIDRHFANLAAHSAAGAARGFGQRFLWYFEYFFLIVRLYLPWFPLMFYGLYRTFKNLRDRSSAGAASLLIIWLLVVLIPFSLAESKVLRYILPVFPVFSIFAAVALEKIFGARRLPQFARAAIVLLTLAAVVIVAFPNYKLRAGDMRVIAPVTDAAGGRGEPIVLYTYGETQWDFQTQLIWYGNRNCRLVTERREIEELLAAKKTLVVVMDKASFADFSGQTGATVTILGDSEKFVCFRMVSG